MSNEDTPPASRCFRVHDSSAPERAALLVDVLRDRLVPCGAEEPACSLLIVHRVTDSFSEEKLREQLLLDGLYVRYTGGRQDWNTSTFADRTVVTVHYWDLVSRLRKLRRNETWEQVIDLLTASSIGPGTNIRNCLIILAQGSILASAAASGKQSKKLTSALEAMGALPGVLPEMKDLGRFSRRVSDPAWWRPILECAADGEDIAGSLAVELRETNLDDYSDCGQLISAIQSGKRIDPEIVAGAYEELVRDVG